MTRLNYTLLQQIRRTAMDDGNDLLVSVIDEAFVRGQEYVSTLGKLLTERDQRREAERYGRWLKEMFIEPHNEERKIFWERVDRCLKIVREDPMVPAEVKLSQIELILLEFDEGGS